MSGKARRRPSWKKRCVPLMRSVLIRMHPTMRRACLDVAEQIRRKEDARILASLRMPIEKDLAASVEKTLRDGMGGVAVYDAGFRSLVSCAVDTALRDMLPHASLSGFRVTCDHSNLQEAIDARELRVSISIPDSTRVGGVHEGQYREFLILRDGRVVHEFSNPLYPLYHGA